jgi:hypothetical protein
VRRESCWARETFSGPTCGSISGRVVGAVGQERHLVTLHLVAYLAGVVRAVGQERHLVALPVVPYLAES